MSRLKWNVAANLAGNAWSGLISLIVVPIFIHYIGIEGWGLIGFFVILQSLLALADMGLSTTLNREFARTTAADARERRDLLRTLETVYWIVSAAVGLAIVAAAPLLAAKWLHVEHISVSGATHAIMLMGLVTALQLPLGLYSGGLLGLQHQVQLNVLNIILWTSRSVGSFIVLALISPTVIAYFTWQAIISAVHTAVIGAVLWRSLGRSDDRPSFRRPLLAAIWRFSAGMMGITATATLLTQMDKVVLSKILSLEKFGYYALASVVAAGLLRVTTPLYLAFFPRFTEILASGDDDTLTRVYHAGCQLAAVILIPIAAVIALFSNEILRLWTRNAVMADRAHVVLTLLIIGTAMNCLVFIPYALQLASGWTRLALSMQIAGCVTLIPLLVWLALRYGAIGGAMVSVLYNGAALAITMRIMHRRLLPGEQGRFYVQDLLKPLIGAVAVVGIARLIFPQDAAWMTQVLCLGAILLCALAAAAIAAPIVRRNVQEVLLSAVPRLRRTSV